MIMTKYVCVLLILPEDHPLFNKFFHENCFEFCVNLVTYCKTICKIKIDKESNSILTLLKVIINNSLIN